MLEVEMEPMWWPDIVETFFVRILRECGASLNLKNKDEWGVMWLQQAKSINQEEWDILDKAEREEKYDALPIIRMTLAMIFIRSSLEMVKVDPEDWDCVEAGAMGWTL